VHLLPGYTRRPGILERAPIERRLYLPQLSCPFKESLVHLLGCVSPFEAPLSPLFSLKLDAAPASKIEANGSHQGSTEHTLGPTRVLFRAASVIAWLVFVGRPCMLRTGCRPTGREGFLRFSASFLLPFLFRHFLPFLCHALHLLGQNGSQSIRKFPCRTLDMSNFHPLEPSLKAVVPCHIQGMVMTTFFHLKPPSYAAFLRLKGRIVQTGMGDLFKILSVTLPNS
jgi:hypothetical protein